MRFIPKALKLAPLAATVALAFSASGALAQEVLKIGLTAPLSGGVALYGKNVLNGLNLAAKEINAQGLTVAGKKYKVEIVALDDKYSPAEASINARRTGSYITVPIQSATGSNNPSPGVSVYRASAATSTRLEVASSASARSIRA